jgi:hypothetical protein
VNHHAVLGVIARRDDDGQVRLAPSDRGLLDAFGAVSPDLLPPGMHMMLSGHAHLWEQLSFQSAHPTQFIAGHAGTAPDLAPLPATLDAGTSIQPGTAIAHFSSWVGDFGFMTLERRAPARWDVKVWDRHGTLRNTCDVDGAKSRCAQAQVGTRLHGETSR